MTTTIRNLLLLVALSATLSVGAMGVRAQDNAREEAAAPSTGDDEDGEVRAEGEVREEGGVKVKVYRFGGLDISGQLKSPQLLYFLNRLRAEFERPKLPHRSFIPELERSTKGREL